jgi:uncharacterized membrane protein
MLAAVKLWAVAHLIANGDLASMLLFGSFLAYAVYDRISVKTAGNRSQQGATGSIPMRHPASRRVGVTGTLRYV